MVANIISSVGDMITGVGQWLVKAFKGITDIIWDSTATTPGFTTFGTLLLIALAASFAFYGLKLLLSAVRGIA